MFGIDQLARKPFQFCFPPEKVWTIHIYTNRSYFTDCNNRKHLLKLVLVLETFKLDFKESSVL